MTNKTCNEISEEKLVAYADGDLPPDEAEQVSRHIDSCLSCRLMVDALKRSMELVQQSWQQEQDKWPQIELPAKPELKARSIGRKLAVAASILVVLAGSLLVYLKGDKNGSGQDKDAFITQAERAINRAGLAAQLLAVADLLAQQPGGMEYATENYNELVTEYADTEQAKQAEIKLKEYSEGSLKL